MMGPLVVLSSSEDIVRDFIWWQIAAIVMSVFAGCASIVLLPISGDPLAMTSIVLIFSACASVVCFSSATQNVVALTAATAIGLSEFIAHADPQRIAVLGLLSALSFITGAMLAAMNRAAASGGLATVDRPIACFVPHFPRSVIAGRFAIRSRFALRHRDRRAPAPPRAVSV